MLKVIFAISSAMTTERSSTMNINAIELRIYRGGQQLRTTKNKKYLDDKQ